jgi:hypothetical protein
MQNAQQAEMIWVQKLVLELLAVPHRSQAQLWCDNLGANILPLCRIPVFHASRGHKHIEIDFHFRAVKE